MSEQDISQQFEQRVAELLDLLGVSAVVSVDPVEIEERKFFDVKLQTEDGGSELIGHHGRMIESLATVMRMLVPESEDRYSVLLDVNGYRDARAKHISDMAHKAAAEVQSTGSSVALQPMKAWERRLIHTMITESYGLSTESVGEEPYRAVIIKP